MVNRHTILPEEITATNPVELRAWALVMATLTSRHQRPSSPIPSLLSDGAMHLYALPQRQARMLTAVPGQGRRKSKIGRSGWRIGIAPMRHAPNHIGSGYRERGSSPPGNGAPERRWK